MSVTWRGSLLSGPAGSKRGTTGPSSSRGRVWRGSSGGSQPAPSTDDSARGAKTRAPSRGGPRGGRGRRGDMSGTSAHPTGASGRSNAGPFRGTERRNLDNGSRSKGGQENGIKAPVFGSRSGTSSGQSSRPSSPFGSITNTNGSFTDRSRDPRRQSAKFSGGSAKSGKPQDYNSRYEQLKLDRARQRTEAVKSGQMADPNQPISLTSAITPTGTCTEMCPEFERVERIVQKMVDKSEKFTDQESGVSHTVEAKMLKRFRRSAAGYDEQLPSDIRTPKTLLQTMNYLLRYVVEDDETLATTHKFLWDRTRSIRNDLSIQQLTQAQDVSIAVKCLERIASVPYLLACIAEIYFNQVRQTTIRSIWKAYCRHPISQQHKNQEWTVDELTGTLAFDDNNQTIDFCEEQGLQFATNADGQMYLNWGQFPLDSVAFQPSSQQTFSYEYVESKRCGRTLVALILGMNVLQASRHGMIDQSVLPSELTLEQNPKQNMESDGLFVSDHEDEIQTHDATSWQSDKGTIGTFKPTFSFPSVAEPVAAEVHFSPSVPSTHQTLLPKPGQLSPSAQPFTPQAQSPFMGIMASSTFSAQQQQVDAPPSTAQPASAFGSFGQPSRSPFPPSQSTPQPNPPTFSSTFGASLGSSLGSSFGSNFGMQKGNQQSQTGTSAPISPALKPTSPSPPKIFSQSTSSPFTPPPKPEETTMAPEQSTASATPREPLFRPFPSSQSDKQPSIFDKGSMLYNAPCDSVSDADGHLVTPPAPFVSSGLFGQPSKIGADHQTNKADGVSSMFSTTPAAPTMKQDQPIANPTPTSSIFSSSPFPSSAQSPAFKAPAPKFEFTSSSDTFRKSNEDIEARKAAEREAAKREEAEKKRNAEEMESKRREAEKREAARREIERERDRRRAAAEEASRLERLEKARKEEEMLRARRLEEERAKAAEREAALREMARQQEEELRAANARPHAKTLQGES
ncbi:80 kD MCM3-associated protein [Histoplasma capsulatum H143]|uniref:80 kD MCM3-associated protein n=1 Tax=Ajellomyces capsulatus (strain H143) TaxID=544712 RepID=C6HSX9_AJECH|nr:80 kD MCM3-associated protein [Histoplasma capsulatum H143]